MAKDKEVREDEQGSTTSFSEALLGKAILEWQWTKKFLALPTGYRIVGLIAAMGALLYLPYLGAVGLWDPWETHYGEVARSMIQRRDYVYPWWESAWFFSKPPLTMWMQALGMQLVGTNRTGDAPVALYTEWGMRLPFAMASIGALCTLGLALSRVVNRRVALASTFALATMPMYWLLTRQTVTDTPFVCAVVIAMSCALIGQLDETTPHRSGWWYAFYVCCGLGVLAKGLLGVGLPAVVLLLYAGFCVIPWTGEAFTEHSQWLFNRELRRQVREGKRAMPVLWAQMYRMRLGTGVLIFFAVCGPWFATLFSFKGLDDEGKLFWYRFLIHDHFNRLAAGVHTTTPGGTFTYFIEQGGYAMFPWVALLPGALAILSRLRFRSADKADHVTVIALLWALFAFGIVGLSATKFHHYVFPVLPPVAILLGRFVDRLWEEGIAQHAASLVIGLLIFIMVGKDLAENPKNFTDLFVYNYDRPYPFFLVEQPLSMLGRRSLWSGDILAALMLALGGYLSFEAFRSRGPGEKDDKERLISSRAVALGLALAGLGMLVGLNSKGKAQPMLMVGLALALVALYVGYEATRVGGKLKTNLFAVTAVIGIIAARLVTVGLSDRPGGDPLLPLLSQTVNLKTALGVGFGLGGGLCAIAALQRSRTMLFGSFAAFVTVFALWFNWDHWVDLSHHWTQRDLFWKYYDMRRPGEPITAFLMNWRGETFYSKNTVKQIKDNAFLARYAALPGRKWALVEHNRLGVLRSAVGSNRTVTPYYRDLNNKFVLVSIE